MATGDEGGNTTGDPHVELARQRARIELLEDILRRTSDVVYRLDLKTGGYDYLSPSVEHLLGFTVEEIEARSLEEVVEQIHPDDRAGVTGYFDRLRAGQPVPDVRTLEYRTVHKDGGHRWVRETRVLVRDEQERPMAFVGTLQEITEVRRAEQRLLASEERYRVLAENAVDFVYQVDADRRITYASPAIREILGFEPEEVIGIEPRELYAEGGLDAVARGLRERFASGWVTGQLSLRVEADLRHKAGRRVPVEILGRFDFDDQGRFTGSHGAIRDITDRRRAEEERLALEAQIQQAQKLESLGVLAGGIAHDFNNLLVGILGNAGLALMDLAPESPAREPVREIEATAVRATELVRQMLAYSGKGRFLIESIDLRALVEQMTHLLEVSVSKKAVLRYEFGQGVPAVEADATQVRQIVMNLVTNASEAIGDCSGVISIATGAMECDRSYLSETYLDDDLTEGVYAYVEVSDTGCGIEREVVEKIFDPFYTTKFAGRGLGLAAVLGIVRGHRGAIKIYTEPRKGTTVKVLLPVSELDAAEEAASASVTGQAEWRGEGVVLLVDDEETVRAVGRRMLERLGFEVITADDGREALSIFRKDPHEIRCVLLDLTMPHMDGEECFRELRRVRRDVRVILSSGYNEQELISRFAGKGLAGFIQKPYRPLQLAEKLREVLGEEGEEGGGGRL